MFPIFAHWHKLFDEVNIPASTLYYILLIAYYHCQTMHMKVWRYYTLTGLREIVIEQSFQINYSMKLSNPLLANKNYR